MIFTLSISVFVSVVYNGGCFRMTERGKCKYQSALVKDSNYNSYNNVERENTFTGNYNTV